MPMEMDTTDLIARARAGDHNAFGDLVQGHSHELQVHCYRILDLATGTVRAYDLLRMLGRDGNPIPLGHALADYGKIAKTLDLLAMCDPDESYRRTVHTQLTVQESRHRLVRKIFHGQRGELRQRYREGQEDQLGALGLPAKRGRITANGEQNILGEAAPRALQGPALG
jgi:hypothetical protein